MAERRMISKKIVDTDRFLDMPVSTRLLYYDLAVRADDDGFVASPRRICRMVGCGDDDLKLLIAKRYIIPFPSGVCVIKDWGVHNYIPKDRYHETDYLDEKASLTKNANGSYQIGAQETALSCDILPPDTTCIQDVYNPEYNPSTEVRLGKDRIGKDKINKIEGAKKPPRPRFIQPTVEEVAAYCRERRNNVDAQHFVDYYSSNGWKVGKNPMKDWKAAVRTWERRDGYGHPTGQGAGKDQNSAGAYDLSDIGTTI